MQTYNELKTEYTRQVEMTEQALTNVQGRINRISLLRVLLFCMAVAGVIYFWNEGWALMAGTLVLTLLPFLMLIRYHNRLFWRKEYLEKERETSLQELAALDNDFSALDEGREYIDASHLYTYDLDVFGAHSLFQCLNRTCTPIGKDVLADWLNHHLEDREKILHRQETVRELAAKGAFRRHFRILGLMNKGEAADKAELLDWAKSPLLFRCHAGYRWLPVIVTLLNLGCLGGVLTGFVTGSQWGILWFAIVLFSFLFTHKISKVQALYGKKLQILGTYARLLKAIDEEPFESAVLKKVKEKIGSDHRQATQAIQKLVKLMNELDQRNNYLMYTVLNGCFFWEIWQIMRIEAWKEAHAAELPQWLEAIGEIDALNSLGTFAYNHQEDYCYPVIDTSAPFKLCGKRLGHPLMPRGQCVTNDIYMNGRPAFIIITGANMAGKSTYLRTIGVNYLLACIGCPVYAAQMELYPAKLITSLRTSDSLNDNESYFFAELKRLKLIIDKLKAGEQLFIILDEILKGTNSMDKQKGSFALIKQFMNLQANGIIATHDLLLGTLRDLFPQHIANYCFEADITGDELTFSYQLRSGVAQNMNACFLMKKMGIAVAE